MAKYLEKALVNNPETKLGGAEKPHMDLGAHLEYIESLLERGGGSGSGSGGGSSGGSVDLLKPILTEGKAPVPNTGYVDKVFFNTKLTTDEVDSLIANANLPFVNFEGTTTMYPILVSERIAILLIDASTIITGTESGPAWGIMELQSGVIFYASRSLANEMQEPVGWNKDAFTSFDTGEFTINAEVMERLETLVVGTANNLLTNLIYSPGLADSGETEVVKSLTDQYKLVETTLKLDTKVSDTYTYDFINNINEDTKEINIVSNIKVNTQEADIIEKYLTTYTNPNVKEIAEYVFYQCDSLTDVSFPKVERIYQYAFYRCTKLVNINMPSVKNINEHAFYNCSSLIDVNFPLLEQTYSNTFENCASLQSFTAPMLQRVCYCMFRGCSSLKNITVPNVTQIESSAFENNYCLTEVVLPNITSIYVDAFKNCYSLIKVFLSNNSICSLGENSFNGCCHILGITNSDYNPNGLKDGYIYVPASLLAQYKVNPGWKTYASQIIGFEDLEAGASLPDYTVNSYVMKFTTQTWYSDEKLTTVVTSVATTGRYYCRLEA